MINQEVKLKNVLSSNKIDIKKRGDRKSMSTNFPKIFFFGKRGSLFQSYNKKNELNQNNNLYANLIKKGFKKNFERKYTAIIKVDKNKDNNIEINSNQINKSNKIKNNIIFSKSNFTFHQLEKIIFKKFCNNYNKYYLSNIKGFDDNERVSIYEYYQGNNIISNKKCKLKVIFKEYISFYNLNEYIMEYFLLKESKYIIRFLLFFIYNRDIFVIKYDEEKIRNKVIIFRSFVKTMIQRIEKFSNFHISFLYKLILNIKEIYNKLNRRESLNNSTFYINKLIRNKALNNILGKIVNKNDFINLEIDYSNYLGILINIPLIKINPILPNYFCFGYTLNYYLHNFLEKRKEENIIDIFGNQNQKKTKILSKRLSTSKKHNYSKSYYNKSIFNEKILQEGNGGISFATIEDLNDKLDNDNYLYYSVNRENNKNNIRRAVNDPEIKEILLFLNNFKKNNKKINKKGRSIKFTKDIKNEKQKDALIDKMRKRKLNKYSSFKKDNEILFSHIKNNLDNNIPIVRNLNNHFNDSKNKSNNSINSRIFSVQKDRKSFDERRTKIRKNINNDTDLVDSKINPINTTKSSKLIKQYSLKNKNKFHKINSSILNNKNSHKDSLVLIPSINTNINRKYSKTSLSVKKSSFTSLSSRRFSIRKSASTINTNKRNQKEEKNKKYKFKKINDFMKELLKLSHKYDIKNLSLENIKSINNEQNKKVTMKYKDYFRRRIFSYLPPKYFEVKDNVWKDEFVDTIYKSKHEYNLLMMKIQKQIQKNKDKYKNLFKKEINAIQISKSADIYL